MEKTTISFLVILSQWLDVHGQTDNFVKANLSAERLNGARWELRSNQNSQVVVYHSLEIIDISSIDSATSQFRLDLHFRQRWYEPFMELPAGLFVNGTDKPDPPDASVTVDADVLKDLWTPDAFVPNARESQIEQLVGQLQGVRIYKNYTIVFGATMHIIAGCPMNFQWYPCDVQFCEIILESFAHPIQYVKFLWENITQAVVLPENFLLRRYTLVTPLKLEEKTKSRFGRNDTFSRIIVNFVFQRQIGHHLIQIYMPTFLIVALSWFSFWLGFDAIPGRVALLVTCMLTLVTMYTGSKADLPPVAYIKMMDIWMAGCLGFVFSAIAEFMIAKYLLNSHQASLKKDTGLTRENELREKKLEDLRNVAYPEFYSNNPIGKKGKDVSGLNHRNRAWDLNNLDMFGQYGVINEDEKDYVESVKRRKKIRQLENELKKMKTEGHVSKWDAIDRMSRWVFPLAFLIFCCIYWPLLLIGSSVWQLKR